MKLTTSWNIAIFLLLVFLSAVALVKKEAQQSKELGSQFECGFSLMNPPHISFSFQFFLISLLFLIFDIEIALVLSYPLEPMTTKKLFLGFGFFSVLIIGLIYEWQKSKLNWSN